jgi:hypothetical protein
LFPVFAWKLLFGLEASGDNIVSGTGRSSEIVNIISGHPNVSMLMHASQSDLALGYWSVQMTAIIVI